MSDTRIQREANEQLILSRMREIFAEYGVAPEDYVVTPKDARLNHDLTLRTGGEPLLIASILQVDDYATVAEKRRDVDDNIHTAAKKWLGEGRGRRRLVFDSSVAATPSQSPSLRPRLSPGCK